VTLNKIAKAPGFGGWDSFDTYTAAQQKEYEAWYEANYKEPSQYETKPGNGFKAPPRYSANMDHHLNFYKGIREKAPIKEDALFSMQACGPALASNKSLFEKKIIHWDPEKAVVV
jgi:hypothetical protein